MSDAEIEINAQPVEAEVISESRGLVVSAQENKIDLFAGISSSPVTDEQAMTLLAPVNEDDLDILPTGEVYLPQSKYRERLNKTFKPGGWGMRPLSEPKIQDDMVVQAWALYANGRFVSYTVGGGEYKEDNKRMTWSDVLETVKSNALMRLCKDLGIAMECWDKKFDYRFKQRRCVRVFRKGGGKPQWRLLDSEPWWDETGLAPDSPNQDKYKRTNMTASDQAVDIIALIDKVKKSGGELRLEGGVLKVIGGDKLDQATTNAIAKNRDAIVYTLAQNSYSVQAATAAKPEAQPSKADESKSVASKTTETAKVARPYTPEALKRGIQKKADDYAKSGKKCPDNVRQNLAAAMETLFPDDDPNRRESKRHSVIAYLTGFNSMKRDVMPDWYALALNDWLKPVYNGVGKGYSVAQYAKDETLLVEHEVTLSEAQPEATAEELAMWLGHEMSAVRAHLRAQGWNLDDPKSEALILTHLRFIKANNLKLGDEAEMIVAQATQKQNWPDSNEAPF